MVLKGMGNITKEWLQQITREYFSNIEQSPTGEMYQYKTFNAWVENFVTVSAPIKRHKGNRLTERTLLSYRTTLKKLKAFDIYSERSFKTDEVNQRYYDSFLAWMEDEWHITNSNTQGESIRNIKTFLNHMSDEGYEVHPFIKSRRFTQPKQKAITISLTSEELIMFEKVKFPDGLFPKRVTALSNSRDLFLIGCYTGLRFSDYIKLTSDDIKTKTRGKNITEYLWVKQKKTGNHVAIPLHSKVKALLMGSPPTSISLSSFGKHIKILAEYAKIDEKVDGTIIEMVKVGNKFLPRKSVVCKVLKHQMVTSHTARRTFATLAYRKGVNISTIMSITGHSNIKDFYRYIQMEATDTVDDFNETMNW